MSKPPAVNDSLVALIAENIIDVKTHDGLHKRLASLVSGASKMSGAWVEGARDAINEGNHAKGYKRGILAIIAAPKSARARSLARGERFRSLEISEKVLDDLEGIIADPSDADLFQSIAKLLRRERQPDIAALAYCHALVLNHNDEESVRSLAAVLRDEDFLEAGLNLVRITLDRIPKAAWLWVQQGNILNRLDKYLEAIDAFQKAQKLDTSIPGMSYAIGRAYVAMGDYPAAVSTFRKAIEDDPKDHRLLEAIADAYGAAGQGAHAVLWYRRTLAQRDNHRIRDKLYKALLDIGEWEVASSELNRDISKAVANSSWDGEIDRTQTLIVDAPNDLSEAEVAASVILGLQLARVGQPVAIVCPAGLANSVASLASKNVRFFNGRDSAIKKLPRAEIVTIADFKPSHAAIIEIADLQHVPLKKLRKRKTNDPKKVGFISATDSAEDVADPKRVTRHLPSGMRITSHKQKSRVSIERTLPLLDSLDRLITDDPVTVVLAAATGCPSVYVLRPGHPLPAIDLAHMAVFGAVQMTIRRSEFANDDDLAFRLAQVIADDFAPDAIASISVDRSLPQDVREEIAFLDEQITSVNLSSLPVSELTGGTRNTSYKLGKSAPAYVMRMGRFPVPQKGFYAKESRNMRIAADAGIAPKVRHTDPLDGGMLIDYVDGEVMRTKSLSIMENAVDAAKLLRAVHKLPGFRGSFDILTKVERNMDKLHDKNPNLLRGHGRALDIMEHMTKVLRGHRFPHYATHNDPLTRNFIRAKTGKMMLIDWECSAIADPHWEVAALSSQACFPPDVWQVYMSGYFGRNKHPAACRVALYEAVCRFYWWSDGLADSPKSDDPAKAVKKASIWNEMYMQIIGSDGFKRALSQAEGYVWRPEDSPIAI